MSEFNLDQQRAIALANARLRLQESGSPAVTRQRLNDDSVLANLPEFPLGLQEFATGGTGILRGLANLPSKVGLGEPKGDVWFPKAGDPESGWKTVGSIADPLGWAIGGGVPAASVKILEKLVALGPAAKKVAEELAAHWAGRIAGRAATGGVTGGTIGALSDEGETTTGAGVGAAANVLIPPVFGGVARGARAIKQAVYPTPGELGVKAAGDKADEVIKALRTAGSTVPGVELTAGQASVPANSAEFAALQKLVSSKDPSRYFGATGVQGQQEAARLASVRKVGQTPVEIEAAKEIRNIAAAHNYGAVRNFLVKMDDEIGKIISRPSMDKALARARELAEEAGEKFQIGINRAEQKIPSLIVNEAGQPATIKTIAAEIAKYPVQSLHYVKMALDDMINTPERFGIGASEVNAIRGTRGMFVNWLEKKAPLYQRARETYHQMSKPINEMQVGQELEKALVSPLGDRERAGVFAGAMREAPRTIKKATGQPRFEDLEQVLKPQSLVKVKNILDDLSRDADYKALAGVGMPSLEKRIGAPHAPPTGWFQPMVSAARSWLNTLLGTGHEKALQKLVPIMEKNPEYFAQLMQAATPQQRAAIDSMLSKYVTTATIVSGAQQ